MPMPLKTTGALTYWQRYATQHRLGNPTKVEDTGSGYAITFKSKRIDTPYVGGVRKKRHLILEIQRWIDG
jgi:hypothetical protein